MNWGEEEEEEDMASDDHREGDAERGQVMHGGVTPSRREWEKRKKDHRRRTVK